MNARHHLWKPVPLRDLLDKLAGIPADSADPLEGENVRSVNDARHEESVLKRKPSLHNAILLADPAVGGFRFKKTQIAIESGVG